ncbi:MAG TPA: HXXEE domain-containing protein [Pyrinomonadaceae bacterium]|jgi:hypothetical protein
MADQTSLKASAAVWLWLFPVVYLLHVAEEYWGGSGFSAYVARTSGVDLSPEKFLIMNAVGWALMIVALLLASRLRFSQWLMVCLATALLINGLSHTINALARAEYNPGLVSGLLIFIPFGAVVLARLKGRMRARRYYGALLVGALISGVVLWLAMGGDLRALTR